MLLRPVAEPGWRLLLLLRFGMEQHVTWKQLNELVESHFLDRNIAKNKARLFGFW